MLKLRSNAGMNMHEHRRERLLALIADHYGGNRKRFCDASDLSEARLAQLLSTTYRQGQSFGEKAARALEERLHLDPLYFDLQAVGTMTMRDIYRRGASGGENIDDLFAVRHAELSLIASSRHARMKDAASDAPVLYLPRSWLESRSLSPDKLVAITVTGVGMVPRLQDGDLVIINLEDTEPADGQVYVINYRGQAVIKRMVQDFGVWYMASDNTARKQYPRQKFDGADCVVIGRIIVLVSEWM